MSEKRFAPTPERLRRARNEGDLPKASEALSTLGFGVATATLALILPSLELAFHATLLTKLASPVLTILTAPQDSPLTPAFGGLLAVIPLALAPMCAASATALALNLTVNRFAFVPISIKPERLNPAAALKELFSKNTGITLARALASATVVAAAVFPLVWSAVIASERIRSMSGFTVLALSCAGRILVVVIVLGLVSGSADAFLAQTKRLKKLRMSFDEMRREARESNGDPHQKAARKRRARAIMRGGMSAVKKATVVIVNPTHIAVALVYRPPEYSVPVVLAREEDARALLVRDIAENEGIPIVEDVPLARYLYAVCREADVIPLESYALVAPIIASVLARQKEV